MKLKMNRVAWTVVLLMTSLNIVAQEEKDKQILNHLTGAVTVGTTGLGFDLAMPIGEYVQVRAGYTIMPSFKTTMHFGLTEEKTATDASQTATGTKKSTISKERFEKYKNVFNSLTGYEIDRYVTMYGRPTMSNGKLLVDVFPFRDKRWFLTGGFYIGAKKVAKAYNATEAMPLLLSVGMHNNLVEQARANGGVEIFIDEDNSVELDLTDFMGQNFSKRKLMGFQLGDYFLVPDENGMVKATVKTNAFRPYVGFGYGDATPKGDKKYAYMLEAGLMFWGGTPVVDCYGTDLTTQHVKGSVGSKVNFIKAFKAFPVINLRVSRRIF